MEFDPKENTRNYLLLFIWAPRTEAYESKITYKRVEHNTNFQIARDKLEPLEQELRDVRRELLKKTKELNEVNLALNDARQQNIFRQHALEQQRQVMRQNYIFFISIISFTIGGSWEEAHRLFCYRCFIYNNINAIN